MRFSRRVPASDTHTNALPRVGRFLLGRLLCGALLLALLFTGWFISPWAQAQDGSTLSVEEPLSSDSATATQTPTEEATPEPTARRRARERVTPSSTEDSGFFGTNETDSDTDNASSARETATEAPTSTPTQEPTEEPTATATAKPTATTRPTATPKSASESAVQQAARALNSAAPRPFGRTVVVLMGGVTWDDWAAIATNSNASTPGLRRLLEESALGAARLRGIENAQDFADVLKINDEAATQSRVRPSQTILRAAATLSSGRGVAVLLPDALSGTFGLTEITGTQTPGWEDASPAVTWARRSGRGPQINNLLNLGWGAAANISGNPWNGGNRGNAANSEAESRDRTLGESGTAETPPGDVTRWSWLRMGVLGEALRQARGRGIALGNADLSRIPGRSVPLREWATVVANGDGAVDGGSVSSSLLERDLSAPFGVRTKVSSVLRVLDGALRDSRVALVAMEWGDTRRAALYAPWCNPSIATSYHRDALQRGDAFLRAVMTRLSDRDRLVLIAVPDLVTPRAQWLPVAYWQPRRGNPGAMLRARGQSDGFGTLPLESLSSLFVVRLGVPLNSLSNLAAPVAEPSGNPAMAAPRLARLLALQSGLSWLQNARRSVQAVLCVLLSGVLLLSLGVLLRPDRVIVPIVETAINASEPASPTRFRFPRLGSRGTWTLQAAARDGWIALMIFPALLWLLGLCLEASWRLGLYTPLSPASAREAGGAVSVWLSAPMLLLVAFIVIGVLAAVGGGFAGGRLQRVPLAFSWLVLTPLGLWIGGFVLPWNETLHLAGHDAGSGMGPRLGDVWSLLWISATLLGVSGLTEVRRRRIRASELGIPGATEDDDKWVHRRVINLRPATFWMLAVTLMLALWGGSNAAALVAVIALGSLGVRLWLERTERVQRLRRRRGVVIAAAAVLVLLLWQRGGSWWLESTLQVWWPAWKASWSDPVWRWALWIMALTSLAVAMLARTSLRTYLHAHYTTRLLLAATGIGALAALLFWGPMGPVLLGLYPVGAIVYDLLYAQLTPNTQPNDAHTPTIGSTTGNTPTRNTPRSSDTRIRDGRSTSRSSAEPVGERPAARSSVVESGTERPATRHRTRFRARSLSQRESSGSDTASGSAASGNPAAGGNERSPSARATNWSERGAERRAEHSTEYGDGSLQRPTPRSDGASSSTPPATDGTSDATGSTDSLRRRDR